MKEYHAYYSETSDKIWGHVVYLNHENNEVKVTFAIDEQSLADIFHAFEDKKFVGTIRHSSWANEGSLVKVESKYQNRSKEQVWMEKSACVENQHCNTLDFVIRKKCIHRRQRF